VSIFIIILLLLDSVKTCYYCTVRLWATEHLSQDSCNNARVSLIDSHGVQSGAANVRCKLGQSRATPQCTPTVLTISHIVHRLFHPNVGVFPLDQIARVGVSPSINLKLISREIIFELFQPMW